MKKIISILTLSAVGIIGVAISGIGSNTLALSYSDNVGVNFTFDQSLTVSLSSADIVINNLAPGSASDSNVIDINVLSNNLSGYTLTSTVGNNTHTNPSYDNTNLNHTGNNSNTFASLSTSDSVSDLSTYDTSSLVNPNVWGYSYSDQTVDNPTWTNYSGLPLYNTTGATLKTSTTSSAEGGDTIKFKIAAKASTTLAPGEYRNVINFTVTAEHNPVSFYDAFKEAATKDPAITTLNGYYKMQDMTADICSNIYTSQLDDNTDTMEAQLIDIRDNNIYWVAKLKDGHCWMTQNLDLDLSQFESFTSDDTDLTSITSHSGSTFEGYSTDGGVITWNLQYSGLASPATINKFNPGNTNGAILGWGNSNVYPYWAESGDTCMYSSDTIDYDAIYTSVQDCANAGHTARDCAHYRIGNYYDWAAATASNRVIDYMDSYTIAPNSICSSGWRLPNGLAIDADGSIIQSEYGRLANVYGFTEETDLVGNAQLGWTNNGFNDARKSPVYFARAGFVVDTRTLDFARDGLYWTSSFASPDSNLNPRIYSFRLTPNYLISAGVYSGLYGWSVRCLAK